MRRGDSCSLARSRLEIKNGSTYSLEIAEQYRRLSDERSVSAHFCISNFIPKMFINSILVGEFLLFSSSSVNRKDTEFSRSPGIIVLLSFRHDSVKREILSLQIRRYAAQNNPQGAPKGFFGQLVENIRGEFNKNKEMKVPSRSMSKSSIHYHKLFGGRWFTFTSYSIGKLEEVSTRS